MKEIKTNKGEIILVDNRHYEKVSKYTWHIDANGYAVTTPVIRSREEARNTGKPRQVYLKMHRVIYQYEYCVKLKSKEHIDHINRNKADNRISNLRLDVQGKGAGINQINQELRKDNTSGYKGIYFRKRTGKWESKVNHNKISYYLGSFETKELAALAYNEKVLELYGEGVYLNDI